MRLWQLRDFAEDAYRRVDDRTYGGGPGMGNQVALRLDGKMVEDFPNAKVVVHPRGARHLVEPERLVQGTADLFGHLMPVMGGLTAVIGLCMFAIPVGIIDKAAIIHLGFAKASFSEEQIVGNLATLLDAVNRAKPSGLKGTFIKGVSISASMGPGVAVDVPALLAVAG